MFFKTCNWGIILNSQFLYAYVHLLFNKFQDEMVEVSF